MDPKKTALVLIEYQNDFTSKGGTLHDAVKGVMEKNNMLQNTVETVKKAREAGCTIVFAMSVAHLAAVGRGHVMLTGLAGELS